MFTFYNASNYAAMGAPWHAGKSVASNRRTKSTHIVLIVHTKLKYIYIVCELKIVASASAFLQNHRKTMTL